jgi:signal transduction histidine kinase
VEQLPEKVPIKAVVDDMTTFLKGLYPGIDYQITIDESLPELFVPKMILTQLFRHLLDNAFRYSAQSAQPAVAVGYRLSSEGHRFSVSDNGPGIDPKYHLKVFDPFFRVPETESAVTQESGLGLTIAHDIIASWGGSIYVDNSGQPGTTVVFTIPLKIGEAKT